MHGTAKEAVVSLACRKADRLVGLRLNYPIAAANQWITNENRLAKVKDQHHPRQMAERVAPTSLRIEWLAQRIQIQIGHDPKGAERSRRGLGLLSVGVIHNLNV